MDAGEQIGQRHSAACRNILQSAAELVLSSCPRTMERLTIFDFICLRPKSGLTGLFFRFGERGFFTALDRTTVAALSPA